MTAKTGCSGETCMFFSDPQSANGFTPIEVTLSGNSMLVKELHQANAYSPMLVTLSGSSMLVKALQS